MSSLDDFIARENINLILRQLRSEEDPLKRDLLRELFVREENKFGPLINRLDIVRQCKRDNRDYIRVQERIIDMFKEKDGYELAVKVLERLTDIGHLLSEIEADINKGLRGMASSGLYAEPQP